MRKTSRRLSAIITLFATLGFMPVLGEVDKSFRSPDGAYSLNLDSDFKQLDVPKGLSLIYPQQGFFIVCVESSGTPDSAEKVKRVWPTQAKGTVLASEVSAAGGRDAAFFVMEGVFNPPAASVKQLGLNPGTKFQTVMAIVPGSKKTYIFQAHYPKAHAEVGRKMGLTIFSSLVKWHR